MFKLFSKIIQSITSINVFLILLFNLKLKIYSKKHILIACYPKSASSYLSNLLIEATGYNKSFWKTETGGASQNFIYLPKVIDDLSRNSVIQQHLKFNTINQYILDKVNVKVIVLVRDIYDTVISIIDHIEKKRVSPIQDEPLDFFHKLSYAEKIDYVIANICPWYIGFYISWYYAKESNKVNILFTTYSEVVDTPSQALKRIMNFYEIEYDASMVEVNKKVNFNQGKKNRGEDMLSNEQKNSIKQLTKYYKDIDFTPIGL